MNSEDFSSMEQPARRQNGASRKQDIGHRFALRSQAERYRDRFLKGRHLATHRREVSALRRLLGGLDHLDAVLDVASGTGRLIPVFAAVAGTTLQLDLSLQMLTVSRENGELPATLGHVQGDARALAVATESFDLVFCHRLLNHVPNQQDRRQIMKELARVSRRFVTVSCLTPPAILRTVRRIYARLKGRKPIDGFVETAHLLGDARAAGLRLAMRTPIRSGIRSAAFLTFEKA